MRRVLHVAWREYSATAITKGFIIGAFIVPAGLLVVMIVASALILKSAKPNVAGSLAVIDLSGQVGAAVTERLTPEALNERGRRRAETVAALVEDVPMGDQISEAARRQVVKSALADVTVELLPADVDPEEAKGPLRSGTAADGGRLALVVIAADSITKPEDQDAFGSYELFVKSKLDDRVQSEINTILREAIREQRILAYGENPEWLTTLMNVSSPDVKEVTEEGERSSLGELDMLIGFGFLALLMISVMMGSQFLLTTTVEEKSSRIVEILLSAVSPMQLMGGKILGQMCVGLTILLVYGMLGGGALAVFGLADRLGAANAIYMFIFFLLAYFMIACVTAAIGAAVNDMREAQSMQTPVMIIVILPYMLWFPISRDPSGTFATVCSFIPPMSPFVMMLRITSTEPPPFWQIMLSIAVGIVACYGFVWACAKIFRVGLLMFGKPPNFRTLLRWVRMA